MARRYSIRYPSTYQKPEYKVGSVVFIPARLFADNGDEWWAELVHDTVKVEEDTNGALFLSIPKQGVLPE